MGMPGSEGESGNRTGGNAGTAPRLDPTALIAAAAQQLQKALAAGVTFEV